MQPVGQDVQRSPPVDRQPVEPVDERVLGRAEITARLTNRRPVRAVLQVRHVQPVRVAEGSERPVPLRARQPVQDVQVAGPGIGGHAVDVGVRTEHRLGDRGGASPELRRHRPRSVYGDRDVQNVSPPSSEMNAWGSGRTPWPPGTRSRRTRPATAVVHVQVHLRGLPVQAAVVRAMDVDTVGEPQVGRDHPPGVQPPHVPVSAPRTGELRVDLGEGSPTVGGAEQRGRDHPREPADQDGPAVGLIEMFGSPPPRGRMVAEYARGLGFGRAGAERAGARPAATMTAVRAAAAAIRRGRWVFITDKLRPITPHSLRVRASSTRETEGVRYPVPR